MINTICCIYSKIPPCDEQLIYSRHVQDDYWKKLGEKSASCWSLLRKGVINFPRTEDYGLLLCDQNFGGICCLHLQGRRVSSSSKGRHRYRKFRTETDWHCKWNKAGAKKFFKQRGVCLFVSVYLSTLWIAKLRGVEGTRQETCKNPIFKERWWE